MSDINVKLTEHARVKMAERDLSFEEVVDILKLPELVVVDSNPKYIKPGQKPKRKFFKGDICLVVADGHLYDKPLLIVVTILWRNQEQWTSEQMRGRR